eukprot:gene3020-4286_t
MLHTLPSRLLEAAARLGSQPMTLQNMADLHGPAGRGTVIVLLAAPCVLPIPGVGNVMGLALLVLAAARRQVASFELSATWARRVLALLSRFHALCSRWSRQRLGAWAVCSPRSWIPPTVALMGALIFLPIPFGNVLPALSLMLLGVGLSHGDGLAALL